MSGIVTDCQAPNPEPNAKPSPSRWKVAAVGCRYVLGVVFLMAAVTKIADLQGFNQRMLDESQFPASVSLAIAAVLPWLELTCGFCLLFNWAIRESALILSVMLLLFLVYSLILPEQADCGCMFLPDPLEPANRWPWLPLRNLVLLICSVFVVWFDR